MSNLAISMTQLLIIGVPQVFLCVLAVYVFTKTKFEIKNYIILSSVVILVTYLVRFLPITLGVNSMLSFLAMILLFLLIYRPDLPNIINLIVSVIIIFMFVGFSEIINELILVLIFGKIKTMELLNLSSELIRSLYMIPTNITLAILILISYFILLKIKNKKEKHGEVSEKAGN